MSNNWYKEFDLNSFSSDSGCLTVIEENKNIPFDIKRIFYEYNVLNNCKRGNHANKNSAFCFICLKGSVEIDIDNGYEKKNIVLNDPNHALYIDKMVWKVMKNFSSDCVLLVLSDCFYDKNEYIRDYDEYLNLIKI